jgi:hypothetical protein
MTLIGLIVTLIVVGLILWAVRSLLPALSIPEPISTIIWVITVVLIVLWLLQRFLGFSF